MTTLPDHLRVPRWEPGMQPVTFREFTARWLVRAARRGPVTLSPKAARRLAEMLTERDA